MIWLIFGIGNVASFFVGVWVMYQIVGYNASDLRKDVTFLREKLRVLNERVESAEERRDAEIIRANQETDTMLAIRHILDGRT